MDSIVFVRDGDAVLRPIALAAVQSLEISRGQRRHVLAGVFVGYAVMFALGFAGHPGEPHTDAGPVLEGIGYGIVYGTPVALLGGIVGSTFRRERWEIVPVPPRRQP